MVAAGRQDGRAEVACAGLVRAVRVFNDVAADANRVVVCAGCGDAADVGRIAVVVVAPDAPLVERALSVLAATELYARRVGQNEDKIKILL